MSRQACLYGDWRRCNSVSEGFRRRLAVRAFVRLLGGGSRRHIPRCDGLFLGGSGNFRRGALHEVVTGEFDGLAVTCVGQLGLIFRKAWIVAILGARTDVRALGCLREIGLRSEAIVRRYARISRAGLGQPAEVQAVEWLALCERRLLQSLGPAAVRLALLIRRPKTGLRSGNESSGDVGLG